MSGILELDFLRHALGACILIGLMLSVMGIYVVLRRIIFVGAALAQVSAAGIALSILTSGLLGGAGFAAGAEFFQKHPESLSLVSTLLGAALLSIRPRRVNLPSEGAIGIGFALASTLAILLVAKAPGGEGDTLLLFYGNVLAVTPVELLELSVLCPLLLLLHLLFRRRFLLASYNPETAQAAGIRVGAWSFLLYITLGVGIAFGIRISGSLLTFSYLVLPALAGLLVARRTWHVAAVAVLLAVVASIAGLWLSMAWDLPSGPTVVAALVAGTAIAWVVARVTE